MSKQKLIDVDSLSGEKVKTNVSMLSYKMVFERTLPMVIGQTGCKFFNCTENADGTPGGILECGAEPKPLKWVIENYCSKEHKFDVLRTLEGGDKINGESNK
jgi:hypothetical protein